MTGRAITCSNTRAPLGLGNREGAMARDNGPRRTHRERLWMQNFDGSYLRGRDLRFSGWPRTEAYRKILCRGMSVSILKA
jgi:hypothetical protein